jgi:hypothetical protein
MVGGLKLGEVIAGVKFTALTMTKNAEAAYFAYLVFGVPLEILGITPSKLKELSITVRLIKIPTISVKRKSKYAGIQFHPQV